VIAHLPLAEEEDEGLALAVADSMELGVQAAFRSPDAAGSKKGLQKCAKAFCD
jgi:hypothetical protein